MSSQADLRARLVEAILGPKAGAALEESRSQLELVARVRDADSEIRVLLQQSVNAARSAGQSWGSIGETLGLSRQAVQQRTPTQWEHRRTVWSGPVKRLEKDGWQVGVLAFPWVYLVRDLGVPAQES